MKNQKWGARGTNKLGAPLGTRGTRKIWVSRGAEEPRTWGVKETKESRKPKSRSQGNQGNQEVKKSRKPRSQGNQEVKKSRKPRSQEVKETKESRKPGNLREVRNQGDFKNHNTPGIHVICIRFQYMCHMHTVACCSEIHIYSPPLEMHLLHTHHMHSCSLSNQQAGPIFAPPR